MPDQQLIYGVTSAANSDAVEQVLASIRGIESQALSIARSGKLLAITSPVAAAPKLGSVPMAHLVAFERVLTHLHQMLDILPFQYGGLFSSTQAVQKHILEAETNYLATLVRIQGCTEFSIRLPVNDLSSGESTPVARPQTGADFLRARKQHYGTEEKLSALVQTSFTPLLRALGDRVRQHVLDIPPTRSQPTLRACILLEKTAKEAFIKRFTDWNRERQAVLTGPWPPFTFARDD